MKTQPCRDLNIASVVEYFTSGIKSDCNAVGIELEHTLLHHDGRPVAYIDQDGQHLLLEEMSEGYPTKFENQNGELIGLARPGSSVTLEPGSQVELSAGPFSDLENAKAEFLGFDGSLAEVVGPFGIEVLAIGYHPTRKAAELELLPKRRYEFMDRYFKTISCFGTCMMRASASTQVSIDYDSVEDCLRKMRLANACVPVFSLICDNTPVFEASPRPHFMMRTEVWEKCDPARCGLVPGVMDADFTLERYADYILDTPAIVSVKNGAEEYTTRTFGEIFADEVMTEDDVEHALSMFFTDVRLKRYIEIRPADAMPVPYAIAYASMIKGLFYSSTSLDEMDRLFESVGAADINEAKAALMSNGYRADIYGKSATYWTDRLIELSKCGLDEREAGLLTPLERLIERRVTLADLA